MARQITRLKLRMMGRGTNYQIAAKARIHPTTLSNYANGKKKMSPKHLLALSNVLDAHPDDLLGFVDLTFR